MKVQREAIVVAVWASALFLTFVLVACLGMSDCRCNDPESLPLDVVTSAAASSSVFSPLASSTAPPVPQPPTPPAWETVEKIGAAAGWWGQGEGEEAPKGPWALLSSREVAQDLGERWEIPYPWELKLKLDKYDTPIGCGVFEKLHEDWRVGYCVGGPFPVSNRTATRIYLHLKKKSLGNDRLLRVRIGDDEEELGRDLP